MILQTLTRAIREQNWFAVVVEFLIVIAGVVIGFEISSWNEARVFSARENALIEELRVEVETNAARALALGEAYSVGAKSARDVLDIMEKGEDPCQISCWDVIVDLMHASQWQQMFMSWTTYDELRRLGLPSDRNIIEAVDDYQMAGHRATFVLLTPPQYRSQIRQLIPINLQDLYWDLCFVQEENGSETYIDPCAPPEGLDIDPALVVQIVETHEIEMLLREWTSVSRVAAESFTQNHQELARDVLRIIDNPS